ncbi:hypothetical protein BASA50_007020 [Batrachochytrium salamandrivorans]|uniref:N-acetyltransferase domain-containing protein n=1 Tax=Batrachochytrium salamandrivorans TaxID=1357716 RepID=A0ABQ8F8D7_9FUNG|nr:hypothetical protein BASA62_003095 [Batrachochytrium salamandrivorans]KAH6578280.1 hypothetical protein BASA60_003670 [Batrachochytrium salamandrivorans]KAH6585173.1 hypothetical protein BASA61_007038 [Batrachochytrium salamandrivorans]KAH6593965.1 hypothetical protein BASA50_007020 [Batrachochytrium salamandrivorans]KAH9250474.1 hypothetical protein BASA81_011714 [Batrachochytrium salamandrivorans]
MSSAYGAIARPQSSVGPASTADILHPLPSTIVRPLLRDGSTAMIQSICPSNTGLVEQLHILFNRIIDDGDTYPQEEPMSKQAFISYFFSNDAYVLVDVETQSTVYGAFYIKPNFPGRCCHICNGGFIVAHEHRNKGVGRALATAYLRIAPRLNYKASMFNLVFETNIASVRLWQTMGFVEIGRVPHAGKLKGSVGLVDAIMFYYCFEKDDNQEAVEPSSGHE